MKRHKAYVDALKTNNVTAIMGHFKEKDRQCHACKTRWKAHEEKETDVNIAIAMLRYAFKDKFDHAFLISRDSDLAPAIRAIRQDFPNKKITVVAPPSGRGHSTELIQAASAKAKITAEHLERCLMPKIIQDVGGNIVTTRPFQYDPH